MQQETGKWKPYNVKAILANLNLVFKTKDIRKLNNPTYSFIMQMTGFIAHYSLYGFQDYYQDLRDFIADLNPSFLRSDAQRDESDSDFRKWYGQAYNQSKADIKRGIADLVEKYEIEITNHFNFEQAQQEVSLVKALAERHGFKVVVKD